MPKELKKPQKPLGFSKTVVRRYLAPEASSPSRRTTQRGAQWGRPAVRLAKQAAGADDVDIAPVVDLHGPARRPCGGAKVNLQGLVGLLPS